MKFLTYKAGDALKVGALDDAKGVCDLVKAAKTLLGKDLPDTLRGVVEGLIQRGVPVDGVGHQMHINIEWPALEEIRKSIRTFSAMRLDNQVTELDVSVYTDSTSTAPVSQEQLITQGYRYRDLFALFRKLKHSISSVTVWGLSDDTSWLKTFPITRDDKPLLFDEELQAKYSYWGVVDPSKLPAACAAP